MSKTVGEIVHELSRLAYDHMADAAMLRARGRAGLAMIAEARALAYHRAAAMVDEIKADAGTEA